MRGAPSHPPWEGGHPGRHAGWKPALLKEERDALHSSVLIYKTIQEIAVGWGGSDKEWYDGGQLLLGRAAAGRGDGLRARPANLVRREYAHGTTSKRICRK